MKEAYPVVMPEIHAEPWIPPAEPPLPRLAMDAADRAGVPALRAWPEVSGNGVRFGGLPVFLAWKVLAGGWHLVLLQPREVGALVPGARIEPLPEDWLGHLDLPALARPLALHPDFPGGASVHVVRVHGPGRAAVRSSAPPAPGVLAAVLGRLSGLEAWRVEG